MEGPGRDDDGDRRATLPFGAHARNALVVSHPAHELLVHGWLAAARPRVHVLTDGSGRANPSRLHHTTRVLAGAGAVPGAIYGRLPDRDLYDAILRRDHRALAELAHELARALLRDGVDYVVADPVEHVILAHEVCRMLLAVAVELANRERDRPITILEFVLMNSRAACVQGRCGAAWRHYLDVAAFERKRAATERYAPIVSEADDFVARHGLGAFRWECLHPSAHGAGPFEPPPGKPVYESHGEALVAAGVYERLVRYDEHVRPLAEALWQYVGRPAETSRPSGAGEPPPEGLRDVSSA